GAGARTQRGQRGHDEAGSDTMKAMASRQPTSRTMSRAASDPLGRSGRLRIDALDPRALPLLRVVVAAGVGNEAVLVGGAVRDACLKRPARNSRDPARATVDVDVAVLRGGLELARRVADRLRGAY